MCLNVARNWLKFLLYLWILLLKFFGKVLSPYVNDVDGKTLKNVNLKYSSYIDVTL